MKNKILLFGLTLTLASCGSWNRIGDLTTIGNRNVDDSKKYTLLTREVEAVAEADADAMEQAVDNLTKKYEGENYAYMLIQLIEIRQEQRRNNWLPGTKMRYEEGKRFTKLDIAYEIGRHEPYHPASLYWDSLHRKELVTFFNDMFGTDIA